MFLFKKHKENSNSTNASNNEKSKWGPTIIRPVAVPNTKKKLPPRPPPPKINSGNGVISVFPLDPPSYEEVLLSDTSSFYEQLNIPRYNRVSLAPRKRSLKSHAPPVPNLQDPFDVDYPLIDFNSCQSIPTPEERKTSLPNDLIELDEIFSSLTGINETKADTCSGQHQQQKPVPKPRLSLTRSASLDATERKKNRNEFDGPALPPRPLQVQEPVEFVCSSFLECSPPPALPPRPKNYTRSEPHGVAMYDYKATQGDDLSFKVSDIITLIHRINDEWLYGCLGDREGMFPRTFVQVIIPLPDDPEFQEDGSAPLSGPRCLALYDLISEREDELSFRVGDMIALVARINDHWVKGALKDRIGLVPTNFVRVIEDVHQL
uniref:SH3 domain-containing protein n=1 Tax=Strigamia maritima TaxID=126957 RepID=T1JLM8_STRMM